MSDNAKEQRHDPDHDLEAKVRELETKNEMTVKLAAAGATDIEAALLVGMSRLASQPDTDIESVIETMTKEKGHLFGKEKTQSCPPAPSRTAGARPRGNRDADALERAAKRAAATGARNDLHEYLRLRRINRK